MIYIILEQYGSYEYFQSNPIRAFSTKEKAEEYKRFLEERLDFCVRLKKKYATAKDEWILRNLRPQPNSDDIFSRPVMSQEDYQIVSSSDDKYSKSLKNRIHREHNAKIEAWKTKYLHEWQCRLNKEIIEYLSEYFKDDIKKFDFDLNKWNTDRYYCPGEQYDIVEVPLD